MGDVDSANTDEESSLDAAPADPPPTLPARELPLLKGTEIGRYTILETLGQGGIGRVVAAWDPQLERRVAIKVLRSDQRPDQRPDDRADASTGMRERILREARALARVVHPNIVAVYDAGYHGDELYVVMELIEGANLRAWLQLRPRTTGEILEVFQQAGRGLAAAHAAGLVHRDFKPDNVLVGSDGRVCVADFGLARVLDMAGGDGTVTPTNLLLSMTAGLVGTPAYMAPEQFARGRVDARTDQFSFCVALFEALHGSRPFHGRTFVELERNVRVGKVNEDPEGREVPAWLRAILERGFDADPEARFPSMEIVLEKLADDPALRRRRRLRAVALAAVIAALGGAAALVVSRARTGESPCRTGDAELAAVWNDATRAQMSSAFLGTGRAYAADTLARVSRRLDGYGAGWAAMRREACEATRVRGTQSDAALDLRMRCLDRRLDDLRATATVLTREVDAETLSRAVTLAGALPPIAACADLDELSTVGPPPADPAIRARVDAVQKQVALARAHESTRGRKEALAMAAAAVDEARALAWKPLVAQALFGRAVLERATGDLAAAEGSFREALAAAAAAHDDVAVASAAVELVDVVGHLLARRDEARHLVPLIETTFARAGADDLLRARWAKLRGNIAVLESDLAGALADYREEQALLERAGGADQAAIAEPLADICYVQRQLGAYREAEPLCRRSVELLEWHLGPGHPDVSSALSFLGIVLVDRGKLDEAEQVYRRALAILDTAVDPDSDDRLLVMTFLGNLLTKRGKLEEARRLLEASLAGRERSRGLRVTSAALVLGHLGRLEVAEGHLDAADHDFEAAEGIYRELLGADNARTAQMGGARGAVLLQRKQFEEARARFVAELEILRRKVGPDHRDVGIAQADLGAALHGLGRDDEARVELEHAVALLEKALDPDHPDLAGPRFSLAQVLWPGDRARAVALAQKGRGTESPALREAIESWLAAH